MRSFGLVTSALIALGPTPAWREYSHPPLGFVVQFPAEPTAATGNYRTALIPSATAHIFSFQEQHAMYVATVVDLADRTEEGAILLGEAASILTQLGDVTSVLICPIEPRSAATYGRFIAINCRHRRTGRTARTWFKDITGAECLDRSHLITNLVFNRGRLYLIQGIRLPNINNAVSVPGALRFANSFSLVA